MPFTDEWYFAPAHKLISMLLAREVSSTELIRAAYERIRKVKRRLNAIVTLCEERALKEAAESDRRLAAKSGIRPLEGLPITIKDCISTEGVRSTDGMKILEHNMPQRDAPTVRVAAGFCALGLGSDDGGSIRVPAHCSGVVGFNPSSGGIPA